MKETRVQSLVQEDPTCCKATKPMCHNHWACALEPGCHSDWAPRRQLLKSAHSRACGPKQEKSPPQEAHTPPPEKSLHSSEDPAQPKTKINKILRSLGLPDSSAGKESNPWVRRICWRRDRLPTPGFVGYPRQDLWASPVAQLVKNPPAMWET